MNISEELLKQRFNETLEHVIENSQLNERQKLWLAFVDGAHYVLEIYHSYLEEAIRAEETISTEATQPTPDR